MLESRFSIGFSFIDSSGSFSLSHQCSFQNVKFRTLQEKKWVAICSEHLVWVRNTNILQVSFQVVRTRPTHSWLAIVSSIVAFCFVLLYLFRYYWICFRTFPLSRFQAGANYADSWPFISRQWKESQQKMRDAEYIHQARWSNRKVEPPKQLCYLISH